MNNNKQYIIILPNGQQQILTEKEFLDLQKDKSIKLELLKENTYKIKQLLKG